MIRPRWDRLAIAAALVVFWAGVVTGSIRACSQAEGQRTPMVQRPPERFEIRDEAMFCHFLTWQSLYERCGPGNLGCATVGGRQLWLVHPGYFPDEGWALLAWHEINHGNRNWSADHED